MKTCKTCKHWGVDYDGDCDAVDRTTKGPGLEFDIRATADDDSGLSARLITGENFGCVLHTVKT